MERDERNDRSIHVRVCSVQHHDVSVVIYRLVLRTRRKQKSVTRTHLASAALEGEPLTRHHITLSCITVSSSFIKNTLSQIREQYASI
jgi:ribosomal protein L32